MIAIYARQSIERPDSVSIETQIDQCKAFAKEDYKVYSDAGYSGKNINRPQFEQLMQDINSGDISAVISYRLDRISRNIVDFANLLKIFEKYNVKYISATEQFDTSTPMGRAMIYIVMVFAQLERETIATRISDNYRFRSAKGLFMGGNTPFGYDSRRIVMDGKKVSILEPNEQTAVLQEIFDRAVSRDSLNSICHDLNHRGIKTAKGNLWVNNSLKRVLQNMTPCTGDENMYEYLLSMGYNISNSRDDFDGEHGMCLFFKNKDRNKVTDLSEQVAVIGLHKPLISSDQFIKAQRILNTALPPRGKRSQRTFLAGMVKCRECGYSFGVKYTSHSGHEYAYYRCRSKESRGLCENGVYIAASEFEDTVVARCKHHLEHFDRRLLKSEVTETKKSNVEVEQLKLQIKNLIDNIGKGNAVVDNLLTQKITSIQRRIDEIIAAEKAPPPANVITPETIEWLKNQLNNFNQLDINQKIDVIRNIVKTVWVDKSGQIEIEYLF